MVYTIASTSCGSCIGIYLNLAFKNGPPPCDLTGDMVMALLAECADDCVHKAMNTLEIRGEG